MYDTVRLGMFPSVLGQSLRVISARKENAAEREGDEMVSGHANLGELTERRLVSRSEADRSGGNSPKCARRQWSEVDPDFQTRG